MSRSFRPAGFLLVAVTSFTTGCGTADDPFPQTGTVFLGVTDPSLTSETGPISAQAARWSIRSITAELPPTSPAYTLLSTPCTFSDNVRARGSLRTQCGVSGIVLDAASPTTAVFHVELNAIRLIKADRPSFPPLGDEDGDGIPNSTDSCVLVPNSDQTSSTDYRECSVPGSVATPDQDRDLVSDSNDNCRFVPNPVDPVTRLQPDANANGIGDACEREIPVILGAGGVSGFDCRIEDSTTHALLPFYASATQATTLLLEFADNAAFKCDPNLTTCVFDGAGVTLKGTIRTLVAGTSGSSTIEDFDYSGSCQLAP